MKSPINNIVTSTHRRVFLQKMTATMGVALASSVVSLSTVNSALAYVPAKASELSAGKIFTQKQMLTLKAIVDAVLPETDTPSASQVDCHGFIDYHLNDCYTKLDQQNAVAIVDTIYQKSNKRFVQLKQSAQQAMLIALENQDGFSHNQQQQFMQLKALILFAYFTSEPGATQALNYQAVPGGYKGSIKVDESSKSWGSLEFY